MKYLPSKKPILAIVALILVLLTACSRGAEPTPQPTQTPLPPPFGVTFCDIDPADICLEGFGLDIEERLLVLFKVEDQVYADIYIRADGPEGEILFECQQSENFTENVYCIGEPFPEGELIKLNIYSKSSNKLIAIGVFNVQFSNLPEPDFVFGTPSPEPSYPNPTYPNPLYPNPTSIP
jgi:hypothetical protein